MELARLTLELHISEALAPDRADHALGRLDDPATRERLQRAIERALNRDLALAPVALRPLLSAPFHGAWVCSPVVYGGG